MIAAICKIGSAFGHPSSLTDFFNLSEEDIHGKYSSSLVRSIGRGPQFRAALVGFANLLFAGQRSVAELSFSYNYIYI